MQCPECMEDSACEIIPSVGHASVLAVLLCGIVFPLLWAGSRTTAFKCGKCMHIFYRRTALARTCLVLLVLASVLVAMTPYLLHEMKE